MISTTQTSSFPQSMHGSTMITSTQTSSFPQSIHSPTVTTATQTSGAEKANGTCYIIWDSEHKLMTADVPRLPSLVVPCEALPDLFRYLDACLSSCGGTNCRLRKTSMRLWLTFPSSSCCFDFQIFSPYITVCVQNNGFCGYLDTALCFPNSLVVSLATEFCPKPERKALRMRLVCRFFVRL